MCGSLVDLSNLSEWIPPPVSHIIFSLSYWSCSQRNLLKLESFIRTYLDFLETLESCVAQIHRPRDCVTQEKYTRTFFFFFEPYSIWKPTFVDLTELVLLVCISYVCPTRFWGPQRSSSQHVWQRAWLWRNSGRRRRYSVLLVFLCSCYPYWHGQNNAFMTTFY